jgi:hypothetical protein
MSKPQCNFETGPRGHAPIVLYALFLITYALTVVMPNSFKVVSGTSLSLGAIYCIMVYGDRCFKGAWYKYLYLSYVVTVFYLIIGYVNGATDVAILEVTIIYIIFPLIWCVQIAILLLLVRLEIIVKFMLYAIVLSCATVAYFFWAFARFGPDAVRFLIEVPNVNITQEGFVAATMHVYGSLIFLSGGLMASPAVVKNLYWRAALIIMTFVVAFTSGRGSLIFALIIGAFVSAAYNLLNKFHQGKLGEGFVMVVAGVVLVLFIVTFVANVASEKFNMDFMMSFDNAIGKLMPEHAGGKFQEGGFGRFQQYESLKQGIIANNGLGVGHGIPAPWYSDIEKPWRYELVWAATVFRVGFIGAFIYALPFLITLFRGLQLLLKGELDKNEVFLFGGFICAFVSSNTNPYIEGYVFHWMYVLPMAYFFTRVPREKPLMHPMVGPQIVAGRRMLPGRGATKSTSFSPHKNEVK